MSPGAQTAATITMVVAAVIIMGPTAWHNAGLIVGFLAAITWKIVRLIFRKPAHALLALALKTNIWLLRKIRAKKQELPMSMPAQPSIPASNIFQFEGAKQAPEQKREGRTIEGVAEVL